MPLIITSDNGDGGDDDVKFIELGAALSNSSFMTYELGTVNYSHVTDEEPETQRAEGLSTLQS